MTDPRPTIQADWAPGWTIEVDTAQQPWDGSLPTVCARQCDLCSGHRVDWRHCHAGMVETVSATNAKGDTCSLNGWHPSHADHPRGEFPLLANGSAAPICAQWAKRNPGWRNPWEVSGA